MLARLEKWQLEILFWQNDGVGYSSFFEKVRITFGVDAKIMGFEFSKNISLPLSFLNPWKFSNK